jgi:glycosyltransferase involved in cell wall biosynthesis
MKIVFIVNDFGGFNNFLSELSISLSYENEVHVISANHKVINIEDKFNYNSFNIKFYYVDFPRKFNLLSHYKVSKKIHCIVNEINPDLINIHFATSAFTSLLYGRFKYKTITTFHGVGFLVNYNIFKKTIFFIIENYSCIKSDFIQVINQSDYNFLFKIYNKKIIKLESLGLGCDINKFNLNGLNSDDKIRLKNNLKIDHNSFVITFVGRFVDFKGFDIVVRSFLKLSVKNIHLILVGGFDPLHSSGLTQNEINLIHSLDSISIVPYTNYVEKFLSISNLFFFPSSREGIPISLIEALCMEVPVLTKDSRGCNELIIDEFNGFVLKSNNLNDYIYCIEELYNDKNLYNKIKDNLKTSKFKYSRNNFIVEQIKLYKDIIRY